VPLRVGMEKTYRWILGEMTPSSAQRRAAFT